MTMVRAKFIMTVRDQVETVRTKEAGRQGVRTEHGRQRGLHAQSQSRVDERRDRCRVLYVEIRPELLAASHGSVTARLGFCPAESDTHRLRARRAKTPVLRSQ